ncbi:MAG: AAA family ATPase [Proteobacteria bacterium]|nr:AAA family ATPase [Pseudomonadota bacterium]
MIKKINKIKNFGIFKDFKWDASIPEFKRYNLLYGWNKSGKTTSSRIFSACEKKSTEFKQYPKDGEFEVETDSISIKHFDCQNCTLQVKVFNRDFIDDNVSFDPSNPCNPIVYVSEEDIDSSRKLKELRDKVQPLAEKFGTTQKERQGCEAAEDKFRKATALNIKTTVSNPKVRDKYYDYNKSAVKTAIENIGIDNFKKLSNGDFDKYKKIINSEAKRKQGSLPKYDIKITFNEKEITNFKDVYKEIKQLLDKKVVAETIERLKDDPELNTWVQHGFELHKKKKEKEKCLFCQSSLAKDLLTTLSKHFSNDYENLQRDITTFMDSLADLKKEKIAEKNVDLYSDLHSDYKQKSKTLNEVIEKLNKWIDEITAKLKEKFSNPLSVVKAPEEIEDFMASYNEAVGDLETIITSHNERVSNHDQEVKTAKETIEQHLIAVAIEEQNYTKIKEDFENSKSAEIKAKDELEENERNIKTLEKETSNIGRAIKKINKHLEEFFGRKEIQLELDNSKKGYLIKRDGEVADNLSESEKNAIAFSYFIVKTQERGFKIKDGIIFIDDPVSSFDSNFIYHCFSLIKNHFKVAAQLFISTHNFELFNHLKDWFNQKNRKVESDNNKITKIADKKPMPCDFFMIENIILNDKRCALIKPLEETLRKFRSEYHFLFARLNQFINDASPKYADFYIIGNIARRFLEIYANFKIPTTGDLASKVAQLDTPSISDIEKDKVYRLIQEFSHSLDPVSTIEHKDRSESQEAIKVLMKIVEESDPKHFESLKSTL